MNDIHLPQSMYALDSAWFQNLWTALVKSEEEQIWQLLREKNGSDAAQQALADFARRLQYRYQGQLMFCELHVLPVVTDPGHQVLTDSKQWSNIDRECSRAVHQWYQDTTGDISKTVCFQGFIRMDWITSWGPTVMREHLNNLLPNAPRVRMAFEDTRLDLPNDAPRLSCMVVGRVSQSGWQSMPLRPDALRDQRLREVLRGLLQLPEPMSHQAPVQILMPGHYASGLTQGLVAWVRRLHELVGIRTWTAEPAPSRRDATLVSLQLNSPEVEWTQFVLRSHQIGPEGVRTVLGSLADITAIADPYRH